MPEINLSLAIGIFSRNFLLIASIMKSPIAQKTPTKAPLISTNVRAASAEEFK